MERAERLAGRSILLTRPEGRAAGLAERLRALGARVETRPTIALEPPADPAAVRRALAALDGYAWIVFTSVNGVRFFAEALGGRVPVGALAAIGPATARALEQAGLAPAVVAPDSRAEGLAAALDGRVRAGEGVLLVQPEVARPVVQRALAAAGARVEAVAFYRNTPHPDVAAVARDVVGRGFNAIVLTSPSTLERLLELRDPPPRAMRQALEKTRLVAIGAVTAEAIEQAGLPVAATAADPTDEGITSCILSLF